MSELRKIAESLRHCAVGIGHCRECLAYGVNGTIESSTTNTEWVGKNDITITCVKLSNNRIRIAIVKSSAFTNATQYTPMAAFVKFTFSFS